MRQIPVSTPDSKGASSARPGRGFRAACFGALVTFSVASQASIVNGGFETGTFSGWTTSGVTAVIGAGGGGAIDGTRQAYLDTSPHNPDLGPQTSTISQTFTGGGYLVFSWNFLTNEELGGEFRDTAYAIVDGITHFLADTDSDFVESTLGSYADMTGYKQAFLWLGDFGLHTVTFGIRDAIDGGVDSALLIDAVHIPEPSMLSLVALGLVGAGMARRPKAKA